MSFVYFISLCKDLSDNLTEMPIVKNSIGSRNERSPTCEIVHETNKAYLRNFLPNRFLPSSVGKALA